VYLAQLGPQGLRETADLCLQKSHYAAEKLCASGRFKLAFDRPTFKEFVVRDREGQVAHLVADAIQAGYLAGVPLGRWYPELADCLLIAVTERRTKGEIDGMVSQLCSSRAQGSLRPPSSAR
jgi:glycine dehydrogenase subunit 1